MTLLPHAHFCDLGYRKVLPIVPPGAAVSPLSTMHGDPKKLGKAPGTKGRNGLWRGMDWITLQFDAEDHARWTAMGAGVGIKTGDQGDETWLIGIDADTRELDLARVIKDCVERHFGAALPVRVGEYPKALYLLKVKGPYKYSRVDIGDKTPRERVELLSDAKQIVVEGVHPVTEEKYRWLTPLVPYAELLTVTAEQLDAFMAELRILLPAASAVITEGAKEAPGQETLKGRLDLVRKAVRAIPNTSALFGTRESYRDMGYAIKAALVDHPREALDIFEDWCQRWTDGSNDPDVVEADWARMKPPFRRGASWLYELAEKHGGGAFDRGEIHFDSDAAAIAEVETKNAIATQAQRFYFETARQVRKLALDEGAGYVIKGLLDIGAMSVIYGDSNAGKTFVVMDMAYAVAQGRPYAGMRSCKRPVLYILSEGGKTGGPRRLEALFRRHGEADDFIMLRTSVNLFDATADIQPLLLAIAAFGMDFAIIVVDTLARAMAGGDENSTKDMSAFVRNVDALRAGTRAHVALVHHTGKDAARGARGSSALRAATDTEIELSPGQITVTKQRDLDKSWSSAFTLAVVELGRDADGDPITSCTVDLHANTPGMAAGPKGAPTKAEAAVLEALRELCEPGDKKGVQPRDVWECMPDMAGSKNRMDVVRQHLAALKNKKYVVRPSRGYWAPAPDVEQEGTAYFDQKAATAALEGLVPDPNASLNPLDGGLPDPNSGVPHPSGPKNVVDAEITNPSAPLTLEEAGVPDLSGPLNPLDGVLPDPNSSLSPLDPEITDRTNSLDAVKTGVPDHIADVPYAKSGVPDPNGAKNALTLVRLARTRWVPDLYADSPNGTSALDLVRLDEDLFP